MSQEELPAMATEQTYIAAACPADAPFTQSQRNIPLATSDRPDHICGIAQRVGYTDTRASDRPLYRLKLKKSLASFKTAVLPGFFVLEQGIFVPYEEEHTRQGSEEQQVPKPSQSSQPEPDSKQVLPFPGACQCNDERLWLAPPQSSRRRAFRRNPHFLLVLSLAVTNYRQRTTTLLRKIESSMNNR